ncbi:hypothetical protein PINS_up009584 [Pythium insidiosum]|nr:hypothetical protein PINS_up009584 [Pythium insidiosum]
MTGDGGMEMEPVAASPVRVEDAAAATASDASPPQEPQEPQQQRQQPATDGNAATTAPLAEPVEAAVSSKAVSPLRGDGGADASRPPMSPVKPQQVNEEPNGQSTDTNSFCGTPATAQATPPPQQQQQSEEQQLEQQEQQQEPEPQPSPEESESYAAPGTSTPPPSTPPLKAPERESGEVSPDDSADMQPSLPRQRSSFYERYMSKRSAVTDGNADQQQQQQQQQPSEAKPAPVVTNEITNSNGTMRLAARCSANQNGSSHCIAFILQTMWRRKQAKRLVSILLLAIKRTIRSAPTGR